MRDPIRSRSSGGFSPEVGTEPDVLTLLRVIPNFQYSAGFGTFFGGVFFAANLNQRNTFPTQCKTFLFHFYWRFKSGFPPNPSCCFPLLCRYILGTDVALFSSTLMRWSHCRLMWLAANFHSSHKQGFASSCLYHVKGQSPPA